MTKYMTLIYKEFLISKRRLATFILSIGMPVAFFLLFSGLWTSDTSMSARQVVLLTRRYLFSMTAYSILSFVLFSLPQNIHEDRKENRIRLLAFSNVSIYDYYVVKFIRTLCYFLISMTIVFSVGHIFRGVDLSLIDWLSEGKILLVSALSLIPLGLLLSYIKSSETLSLVSNILYMGLGVLGGLWFPVEMFPTWLQEMSKITPSYHINAILIAHFEKSSISSSVGILVFYFVMVSVILAVVLKRIGYKWS